MRLDLRSPIESRARVPLRCQCVSLACWRVDVCRGAARLSFRHSPHLAARGGKRTRRSECRSRVRIRRISHRVSHQHESGTNIRLVNQRFRLGGVHARIGSLRTLLSTLISGSRQPRLRGYFAKQIRINDLTELMKPTASFLNPHPKRVAYGSVKTSFSQEGRCTGTRSCAGTGVGINAGTTAFGFR
jgi:hypothetical protein